MTPSARCYAERERVVARLTFKRKPSVKKRGAAMRFWDVMISSSCGERPASSEERGNTLMAASEPPDPLAGGPRAHAHRAGEAIGEEADWIRAGTAEAWRAPPDVEGTYSDGSRVDCVRERSWAQQAPTAELTPNHIDGTSFRRRAARELVRRGELRTDFVRACRDRLRSPSSGYDWHLAVRMIALGLKNGTQPADSSGGGSSRSAEKP